MPFHSIQSVIDAGQVIGPFSQPGAYAAFVAATGGVFAPSAVDRFVERRKAKKSDA